MDNEEVLREQEAADRFGDNSLEQIECDCGNTYTADDAVECKICHRKECPECATSSWTKDICSGCLDNDPIYQIERRRIALEQALKDVKKDTDEAIEIIQAALKSDSILDIVQGLTRAITKINTTATMQLIINKVE